jgi:SP family general alpha glucoside:H+ symporter-like MFS transporter
MSDPVVDSKAPTGPKGELEDGLTQVENVYNLDEKATGADYKADAVEAENAEHNMTVIEAMKAYPMASFWAFVMSCTIVSCFPPLRLIFPLEESKLTHL